MPDSSPGAAADGRTPDAYQRLLLDVIRSNPTLFVRADEVDQAWQWVDQIVESWTRMAKAPETYISGTWGPSGSIALVARDGRRWHE